MRRSLRVVREVRRQLCLGRVAERARRTSSTASVLAFPWHLDARLTDDERDQLRKPPDVRPIFGWRRYSEPRREN
jgi:hypothetical protein